MRSKMIDAEDHEQQSSEPEVSSPLPKRENDLPPEILGIFEFLSLHPRIVFKSQQRNDPELLPAEKKALAREIYTRNPQIFLLRFGSYMEEQHLKDFARLSIADGDEELFALVTNYSRRLQTHGQDVKNRRYAALQDLIRGGEYFSEQEMMKRAPDLYYEMVGQYLSRLEKKARDGYNVRTTSMSGIMLHTIEQNEMSEVMKKAANRLEKDKSEIDEDSSSSLPSLLGSNNYLTWRKETKEQAASSQETSTANEMDLNREKSEKKSTSTPVEENSCDPDIEEDELNLVPVNYRHQWGAFEDDERVACSSSSSHMKASSRSKSLARKSKKKLPVKEEENSKSLERLITGTERDLLRQEFLGIMYEQFLSGQDTEFDYTTIDENTQFDDLQQINRDKEDEYFAESDEDEDQSEIPPEHSLTEEKVSIPISGPVSDSEDELDIYMNHLKRHHSLQQQP